MKRSTPQTRILKLSHGARPLNIDFFLREGPGETILCVHGLGGSKENFWEACKTHELASHTIIGFDNPGTGSSSWYEDMPLSVDDLVQITSQIIDKLGLRNIILMGASMGGLITLLYMLRGGMQKVKAYVNIEGNLMPEDCMFSGQVVSHTYENFREAVFPAMIRKMKKKGNAGYHIIANNLELNTIVKSYYDYSFQTVEYSAAGELLDQFVSLEIPKIFIYGEDNKALSYIPQLVSKGVDLRRISDSNHFVFYDNPAEMYREIAQFIKSI